MPAHKAQKAHTTQATRRVAGRVATIAATVAIGSAAWLGMTMPAETAGQGATAGDAATAKQPATAREPAAPEKAAHEKGRNEKSRKPRLTDDRAIAHALNRLAFGPAPGDVARVREMGLDRYIEQQLHPEQLPDTALRDRLAPFESLQLSSRDVAARYYLPLEEFQRTVRQRQAAANRAQPQANQPPANQPPANQPPASMPPPATAPPTAAPPAGAPPSPAHPKPAPRTPPGAPAQAAPASPAPGQEMPNQPAMGQTTPRAPAQPGQPAQPVRDPALGDLTPAESEQVRGLREQSQRILAELQQQKVLRAVYGERQLEEVLVDFWFNHFNVFANKGPVRTHVTSYERDVIRPHVFGKFRDLLGATAHSPAMLFYLDNWQSINPDAPRPAPGRPPTAASTVGQRPRLQGMSDEERAVRRDRQQERQRQQQARERQQAARQAAGQMQEGLNPPVPPRRPVRGLNENYARELLELHTLGVDGGYTQQDIIQVAHAFTGWTIQDPYRGGDFLFNERLHTPGPKKVLGKTIDKGGVQDGEAVLDLLAAHPSTAKFIASKLARRLVADEPPPKLVARAAATFRSTGGDLRAVVRTIVTSPEFLAPETMRAKVKTPLEFVASALRATGAQVDDAMVPVRNLQNMGMPLYLALPPTGYRDRADAWVNTGALLNRMNFAVALVNNRLRGVRVDLAALTGGAPTAPGARGSADVAAAREGLIAALLSNEVSETTRATIEKGNQVAQVAALTLGSPEFQRR